MGRLLKGALAHKVRLTHTAVAVALAVTLVAGTFALAGTIDRAFHQAATRYPDGVAVVVRSAAEFSPQATSLPEREPVPQSLLATVQRVPGVQEAWGTVWGYAQIVGTDGKAIAGDGLPVIGSSWSPADSVVAGRAPTGPDEVVIDEGTARANHLSVGDRVKILFEGVVREFVIGGLQGAKDFIGSTFASFDLQTTQTVMGEAGRFDQIAVRAEPGVTPDELRARIAGVLPDRYQAVTDAQAAREAEKSWTNALRFLTTGLLVFAAIALLVSAFIIFNTFSILVAQRTRELGLLRALGATRRQVTASVLAEALAVGVAGSTGGVAAGYFAAGGLLAILRSTGFDVPPEPVAFTVDMVVAALVSGVVVTVLAASIPARRATQVAPVVGIASVGGESVPGAAMARGRRLAAGSAVAAAGAVALVLGVGGSVPRPLLAIAAGATAVLAGLAVLAPLLAGPVAHAVGAPLTRVLGEPAKLGRENATRNPRRTATTATALTIGLGLIGVVTIMAASMRASATRTVEEVLRADFVVNPADGGAGVPPLVTERLRQVDGVQLVSPVKGGQWGLDGRTVTLLAVDPATVTAMYALDRGSADALRGLDDKGVLVRDTVAARHKWKVGDQVSMTFARTGTRKLKLQGTFSAPSVRTDYVITVGAYEANYAQQLDLQVSVQLAPDTAAEMGRARIEKALADVPNVAVLNRSQVLAEQNDRVQSYLVPVTALLALSVTISLLGIANTLSLSIHERTRELGMLRAIGMGRRQLRAMVKFEAAIISGLGAVLGVVVAVVFGWALVSAMRGQGVTEFVVPVGQLAGWMALAVAAGLVAAALPARRAARLDPLEAVAAD